MHRVRIRAATVYNPWPTVPHPRRTTVAPIILAERILKIHIIAIRDITQLRFRRRARRGRRGRRGIVIIIRRIIDCQVRLHKNEIKVWQRTRSDPIALVTRDGIWLQVILVIVVCSEGFWI